MASTRRDNLLRLLDGGRPDWIPFSVDIGAAPGLTEPVERMFRERTGASDWAAHFETDYRICSLRTRFSAGDPAALHGDLPQGTTFDEWGIGHWAGGSEGTLDRMFPPLAGAASVREIAALPEPEIEPGDAARVAALHAVGLPVFGYAGSIYEWAWWLRGMEQFMIDLASDPSLVGALVAKVERHTTRLALATAALGVDVLCFYDDVGMQSGMQIAPAAWRAQIRPAWARVLDTVRRAHPAAHFFLHSCGKIDAIVPDIVDLGFHALHPLQPECMDFAEHHARHGSRIVLCATLSAQRTLPFGTPADVRREVARLAAIVADRRALLLPSNRIQPETPWENLLAFVEAARALRGRRGPAGA